MEHDHDNTEEQQEGTVTVITEHDSEQEGEGNHRESRWVSFLVCRHTISVSDLLEHPGDVIHFEEGGGSDRSRLIGVRSPERELSSLELHQLFLDVRLLFDGSPQEADVGGGAALHHVKSGVDSLLLGNEPLVHLELGNTVFLLSNAVDGLEVLSDLTDRGLEETLSVSNIFLNLEESFSHLGGGGNLESLSHERFADLENTLSDELSVLVHNHVGRLGDTVLSVLTEVSKGFSSGDSEE